MYCLPKNYIGTIAAITFLGAAFGSIAMPFSGDLFGRWNASQFLCLINLALVADTIGLVQVACFWIGFLTLVRYANMYLLFVELMDEKYSGYATAIFMCGDSAMGFYLVLYLRFFNKDVYSILSLSITLSITSFFLYYLIPESPKWLVSVGRYNEARASLKHIAKMNGCDQNLVDKPFKEEVHSEDNKLSTASEIDEVESLSVITTQEESNNSRQYCFFSTKTMMINFWILALMWTSSDINFYTINFYMPYVPGDVFLNTTYSITSEIIANLASGVIFNVLGVKYSFVTGYVLASIGSLLIATSSS